MYRSALSMLALSACLLSAEPVRVQQGALEGAAGESPDVRVYKGIPYAAPPTGSLRWKAPKAPTHWTGTRKAVQFSDVCMQTPYPANSIYYSAPTPMSEDCLYLNIWTTAKSSKDRRPVMVWIHGGALTRGSGSLSTYDGEAFAKKGVVLVTINYRLGVFGFLAHPELSAESDHKASGNYALLDQIAALEWVQKNIEAFGGDPQRVTIFGESAGSWSVNYLMASPLAKGLFQRVIGESGGAFGPMKKLGEVESSGAKLGTLESLRAKSAEDLLHVAIPATPNVDGWLLPTDVYTTFASGKQNDVPVLAGSNADEAKSLAPWPANGKAAAFVGQIRQRFGDLADEFLKVYPAGTDDEAQASHYASYRDLLFGWQMRTWARLQTKTGKSNAYLYYFSRVPPGPQSSRYGAFHAAEIAYVFGNLETSKRQWEDTDRRVSNLMSAYWVNFATTGNPNGSGLPTWDAYDKQSDMAMEFGDTAKPVAHLHQNTLDLLDRYSTKLRGQ